MTAILISFIIITLVNVLAYIWAYKKQSDHLTDISYSLCFIAVTLYFLMAYGDLTLGRLVLALMVILWGVRLGGFLFYRIHKMGKDARFDAFRGDAMGFLKFWLLQSISISIIVLPVLFGLLSNDLQVHIFAVILWIVGWTLQSVADWQKFTFRSQNPFNSFINNGLFTYVRHPNYTGEILIWLSIFWYVSSILAGWEWIALISPIWIIVLLVKISGIPLIEEANQKKYQGNLAFAEYTKKTWRLIPFLY
jgi:steroid 5-alpha reductase family enzyme